MNYFKIIVKGAFILSLLSTPFLVAENSCSSSHPHIFKKKTLRADYVIIGVGTAGAVLAKKLTDNKKTSVIAIHNGKNLTKDPDIRFSKNVITTVISSLFDSPFFEAGKTTPQIAADDRKVPWLIGLPLGGASSINAEAYCRGTNEIYSQWEAIAGPLWSVDRIDRIYKKLETYDGKTNDPNSRGTDGPLNVRQNPVPSKVSKKFTRAIIQGTGFPFVEDYNDIRTPIGASRALQYTQKGLDGALRVSSAVAFLNKKVMTPSGRGVHGRKLRVFFESSALRTIWEGNKAIGIEFVKNGRHKKVYANKGVIVCAGLRSSPFLMHSGIGPKELLDSLGIPVVFANDNVGQGLVDQPQCLLAFETDPNDTPVNNHNSAFASIAFFPSPTGDQTKREIRFTPVAQVPGLTAVLLDLSQPRSRGSVTINSSNPLFPPVVNIGLLSNPEDLELYQQALQVYVKQINNALQQIDPTYKLISPDPSILDDTNLLTDFIKETVLGNQCFQSHCLMAPLKNAGVVDSRGRVHGVNNLIVADDSIVPLCMDGTTMASAYLIEFNIARILNQGE
ncbi:MAG: GMC family oxidoreductase N-terminal domain-containing protein [Parachlamydiaceae bacterium]|nr:GMC family oxidoreductase N-terminal domain-containing protein [Parachlamydiaceae bacterium]